MYHTFYYNTRVYVNTFTRENELPVRYFGREGGWDGEVTATAVTV